MKRILQWCKKIFFFRCADIEIAFAAEASCHYYAHDLDDAPTPQHDAALRRYRHIFLS